MTDRSLSGLTPREVALIKSMLRVGKNVGFHSGKIQSYFSRPDRNVNPARIYDIRDGRIGANIPAATETELYDFISRFEKIPITDDQVGQNFPRMPTPAYIGVLEGRVRLLPRDAVIIEDEDGFVARKPLLEELRRLSILLADAWDSFQVDRRLKENLDEYSRLAESDHRSINIFSLDTEFNILDRLIGSDTGCLGERGELQWKRFTEYHYVFRELYPEMLQYRAALPSTSASATLPEDQAYRIVEELLTEEASDFVAPDVPTLIRERLDDDTADDPEAKKKRTYDVTALVSRTAALLHGVIRYLPRAAAAATAAHTLWDRVWVPLREFFRGL